MSHFTVAVLTRPDEYYEELLEPYQEGSDEYEEFVDRTEEVLEDYENGGRYVYRNLNRTQIAEIYQHELYRKIPYGYCKSWETNLQKRCPVKKGWRKIYLSNKQLYKNIETFAEKYYGYSVVDDTYGYYHNPNSKWDWYDLGGRWQGMLLVKDENAKDTGTGRKGVFDSGMENNLLDGYKWVDQARLGDIEWEKMREYKLASLTPYEEMLEKNTFYKPEYLKKLYPTEESYIEQKVAFATFAFLSSETGWQEKGEMGWFGCSSDTPEESATWNKSMYNTYLKNADPDCILSIVDCHI